MRGRVAEEFRELGPGENHGPADVDAAHRIGTVEKPSQETLIGLKIFISLFRKSHEKIQSRQKSGKPPGTFSVPSRFVDDTHGQESALFITLRLFTWRTLSERLSNPKERTSPSVLFAAMAAIASAAASGKLTMDAGLALSV
jgi:hypothetical protein